MSLRGHHQQHLPKLHNYSFLLETPPFHSRPTHSWFSSSPPGTPQSYLSLRLFFFFLLFLGPHPQHMEVPRLGVQLPAYATATAMPVLSCICDPHHSSWQRQIPNPLGKARDRTATSWFLLDSFLLHYDGNSSLRLFKFLFIYYF